MRKWVSNSLPGVVAGMLLVLSCSRTGWGYSREVYTSFKAGPGYRFSGVIYFLANYRLHRVPEGIRRFPDGGRVRPEFEASYLMSVSGGARPRILKRLPYELDDSSIAGTAGRTGFEVLILEVDSFRDKSVHTILVKSDGFDVDPGDVSDAVVVEMPPDLNMTGTNNAIRNYPASEIGFPSPLDYCRKTRRAYQRDLVVLNGDWSYRRAVITFMKPDDREAAKILEAMSRREQSLEGYRREAYRQYSEETRRLLAAADK